MKVFTSKKKEKSWGTKTRGIFQTAFPRSGDQKYFGLFLLLIVFTLGNSNYSNAQTFTPGNLAVFVAAASASNTTGSIVELNTTTAGQSAVNTFPISGTGASAMRFSGSATSTAYIANSNDGTLLCFTGANNTDAVSNVNTLNPRAVGTFNASGTFSLATTYTGASGNQTRCASTINNTNWFIGDQGGFYTNGTTSASPTGNMRGVKSFGGIVYAFTASATLAPLGTISAPSGGTYTALPGLGTGATSRQDFYLVSSGSNGSTYDVLYILDATTATAGTIFKYSLVSGNWTANGSYTTSFGGFGLAAKKQGSGAYLFVSSGTGATTGNNLVRLTDAAGYNATIAITTGNNVTLYTSAAGTIIKGVAFAPVAITPVITGAATATAFTTTYGTASAVQSFAVSGANLTANLIATAPSGFEVSSDGTTYGTTATFIQSAGNASGTLRIRLAATATVSGSYNSQNIALTSTGATTVNITTSASGNSVSAKGLTITGITANDKTYDGNATASISGTPAYTGLVNGESFSVSGAAVAVFASANAGTGITVNVSGYTAPSTNYSLTQPVLSANINQAPLTILSAAASTKIYDGTTSAAITGTLNGIIGTDNVILNGTGTFAQSTVGTAISVTSTSTLSGTQAANYSLTQPIGLQADIQQKPLTINGVTASNKIFDGNTTATLFGTASLVGVLAADAGNVVLGGTVVANFTQSAVGNNIPVIVTGYTISGSASGNYSLTQPAGLTANITSTPTPVITSALTASATYGVIAPTYTITATNSPTSYSASGLPAGLTLNSLTGQIDGTATADPGDYNVLISGTNAGGQGTEAILVYSILTKALTVPDALANDKVYDRNNTATISGTLNGIVGMDNVSLNGTGVFAQVTVGTGISVTSTSTLSGTDAYKYSLTQPTGLSAAISQKNLTVTGAVASNKVYDGNTMATITGAVLSGVISPDVVTVSGNGNFVSAQAGNNIQVNTSLVLGGADVLNYSLLTQPIGLTANIQQAGLTISGISAIDKTYDGTTTATLSGTPVLNGVVGLDDVSVAGTIVANFNNKTVGSLKPVTVSGYTLTGMDAGNYTVSQPIGLSATIMQASLTISGAVAQDKLVDGNTNAVITGTLSGIISPDVVSLVGTGQFASSAVGNNIAVTSTSTLTGADAANYAIDPQPSGLTANILPLPTFTAGNVAVLIAAAAVTNTTGSIVALDPTTPNQSATLLNTFLISGTGTSAIRFSGSAASTGYLSNSNDGSLLCFTGANNASTSGNVNTLNPRGVGTFDAGGTFNLATAYTGTSGNQTRSASSINNTNWYIGDQGGFYTNGSTSASPTGNARGVKAFGGIVYSFTASATSPPVGIISATSGGTFTGLPGLANGASSRQDFYLISSGSNGNTYDVLYVLDATTATAGTIFKYSLVSGSWTANGSYTTSFGGFGLAAKKQGTGAYLFVSSGTGATTANNLVRLTDAAGYNAAINITTGNNVTLYTAATGTIIKGVAFAPAIYPNSSVISGNSTVCAGSPANINVVITGGVSPYTVVYTDGTNNFTVSNYTSGTAIPVNPPITTTYTLVSITDAAGAAGIGNSGSATVTVHQLPMVNFTGLAASYCSTDGAVTLTGNQPGGVFSGAGITDNGNGTASFNPATAGVGGPYTITYTYFDGTCSNSTAQQVSITVCNTNVTVNLKLWLQGYYLGGGSMQPVLANQGIGSSATDVDNVTIELHDPNSFVLVESQTAVLQTDGTVSATFTQPAGTYFVAVKHRSSLQTWSASPVTCTGTTALYDFTTAASQAFGDNQIMVEPGVWAIFTGDINQDDYIDGNDFPAYDVDSYNGVGGVYVATDMNGDGFVDGNDYPLYDVNSYNGVSAIYPQ